MLLTRRRFLGATAAGLACVALPLGPRGRARAAGTDKVLVAVFLRGGADGLHLLVPRGDPDYYALRPGIQVAPGAEIPLTAFFGLHPQLGALAPLFQSGALAAIHAVGSPDDSRSHFDAQDFMERAAPGDKSVLDGWLNRYLARAAGGRPLAGVTLGYSREGSLAGPAQNLALPSLASFDLGGSFPEQRKVALTEMHGADPEALLARRTAETFAVMDTIAGVSTATDVVYPDSRLGRNLRDVAALIKSDVGVSVAAVSRGGWDTHDDQVAELTPAIGDLGDCLAAFHADLGSDAGRVLTLAMTEFGRTTRENGTRGTDHGRASIMLALGGGIQGGRVLLRDGLWPGLHPEDDWRDLDVTTDFRDVFAEVLDRHLGLSDLAPIFPGFTPDSRNYAGLYG